MRLENLDVYGMHYSAAPYAKKLPAGCGCIGIGVGQVGPVLTRPHFAKLVGVTVITINTNVLVHGAAAAAAYSACLRACNLVHLFPSFGGLLCACVCSSSSMQWLIVLVCKGL